MHRTGAGKAGVGQISTATGALKASPYGFASRFEGDVRGTNSEEILAAPHTACFAMASSFASDKAGIPTAMVDTKVVISLTKQGEGFVIDRIALTMEATAPCIADRGAQSRDLAVGRFRVGS